MKIVSFLYCLDFLDSPAAPAAALPFGVLLLICGDICTSSGRSADILHLFRITGNMSIMIFWAVLGSPKFSARPVFSSAAVSRCGRDLLPGPQGIRGERELMTKKSDFRIEPANHDGISGFLLYQMDGDAVLVSQFVPADAFPDFINESGIILEQNENIIWG